MRFWLRVVAWIAATLLVLAGLLYGFDTVMSAHFNPDPPVANFPKPRDALEAQRQDVRYFRQVIALDRAFSSAARAEAEKRIAELERRPDVLQGEGLRVALLRIMALADNGHTSLYSNDGGRGNLVPIRVTPFADGIYVLRAKAEQADLLGARVVAIDGHPIEELMTGLADLRGGTPAWRRVYAALLIMSPGILNGAGFAPDPARSTWRFVTSAGATVERTLVAAKPGDDEPYGPSEQWLSAKRLPGETEGWRPLIADDARLPITLRDFDRTFGRAWVDGGCVLLLKMKSVQDENGESISDFLAATEAEMRAKPPCGVILDLRFNGGGDYTNVADFSARLPGMIAPDARIFVLTGSGTFSAAMTMTAFVKQAAPARVSILGEPVGDRMSFWSEGGHGCLPNAKLCVHYSTGKHDYANACTDWDTCYWVNWIFPARVKSLAPDETVAMRFSDYVAGRDPAFERAVELAAERR